jgi:hypothetical protein
MPAIPGQVPVSLITDGLDESPESSGIPSSRGKVLEFVKGLVELHIPNLRIFSTSCFKSDIRTVEPITSTSISIYDEDGQKSESLTYFLLLCPRCWNRYV